MRSLSGIFNKFLANLAVTRAIQVGILCSLNVACAGAINLEGMRTVGPTEQDQRRVFRQGEDFRYGAPIRPQDILALSADAGVDLQVSVPAGPVLTGNVQVARLPYWILETYGTLEIAIQGVGTVTVCKRPKAGCTLTVDGGSIGDVATKLSRTPLTAQVEPSADVTVLPGDSISVTLQYMVRQQGVSGTFLQTQRSIAVVTDAGTLAVPKISWRSAIFSQAECDRFPDDLSCGSGPTIPGIPDGRIFARERAVAAALENADSAILVWKPDAGYALWQIERCLNFAGWTVSGAVNRQLKAECKKYRIDDRFVPKGQPEYLFPRYTLGAGPQVWHLVDTTGYAHSGPYRSVRRIETAGERDPDWNLVETSVENYTAGRSIEAAVRAALRRRGAQDLAEIKSFFGAPAFLVVVPAEGAPFFGQNDPSPKAGRLDTVALRPGDTVFITTRLPIQ